MILRYILEIRVVVVFLWEHSEIRSFKKTSFLKMVNAILWPICNV